MASKPDCDSFQPCSGNYACCVHAAETYGTLEQQIAVRRTTAHANFFLAVSIVGKFTAYACRSGWASRPEYSAQLHSALRYGAGLGHAASNAFCLMWARDLGGVGPQQIRWLAPCASCGGRGPHGPGGHVYQFPGVECCATCDAPLTAADIAANVDDAVELTGGRGCRKCMRTALEFWCGPGQTARDPREFADNTATRLTADGKLVREIVLKNTGEG